MTYAFVIANPATGAAEVANIGSAKTVTITSGPAALLSGLEAAIGVMLVHPEELPVRFEVEVVEPPHEGLVGFSRQYFARLAGMGNQSGNGWGG